MPTMPVKNKKKRSEPSISIEMSKSTFHQLKFVEAKWKELCEVLEVDPRLSVDEIVGVMHADRETTTESV